jgi:hypothetical protein
LCTTSLYTGRTAITEPTEAEGRYGKTICEVFRVVHVEGNRELGASLFGACSPRAASKCCVDVLAA